MKKILISLWLMLLPVVAFSQSQVTVTGSVSGATSGAVLFNLSPWSTTVQYYVSSVTTIANQTQICAINSSGAVRNITLSGPCMVWGNDIITPGNTTYTVVFQPNGRTTNTVAREQIVGNTYNLNTPVFGPQVNIVPQFQTITTSPIAVNLVPAAPHVFNVGNAGFPYATGYFDQLFIGGVPAGGGSSIFTSLTVNGPIFDNGGMLITAPIGAAAVSRSDASIEMENLTCYLSAAHCHLLFSLTNLDPTEESAFSYQGILSNSTGVQQGATFVRFVNSVNTFNNYKTSFSLHLVDSAGDKTPYIAYSNNSMNLLAGDTSAEPWNVAASNNTLNVGSLTTPTTVKMYSLLHVNGVDNAGALLPPSGKGIQEFYKNTTDEGFIQSYDITGATFHPLELSGSLIRINPAGNQTIYAPSNGPGLELLYRTDGTHNESAISSFDRTTSLFHPLEIASSIFRVDGTPSVANAPTVGIGIEMYFRTDTGHDEGVIQSYSRDVLSFKPLDIVGSMVRIGGTPNISFSLSSGEGIEMYFRTDGMHDEGQIQSFNASTSTFKPLMIAGSYVDFTTMGRFKTSATNIAPTTGKGLELYYHDATPDSAIIQAYDHDAAAYRPIAIDSSKLALNPNSGGDIQWGTPLVSLGGGATATLGTIGMSGPTTAAQYAWVRVLDEAGIPGWMGIWR